MIQISGLPAGVTESDLKELFRPYGKITWFKIFTEENKSIAQIALDGHIDTAIDTAVRELNGKPFRGQCILTVEAHPPFQHPDGTVSENYEAEKPAQPLSTDQKIKKVPPKKP